MGVQAYDLDGRGVVLICTTTDLPLPLSIHAFASVDEAESFLTWCRGVCDPRVSRDLDVLVQDWRKDMAAPCVCGHERGQHDRDRLCDYDAGRGLGCGCRCWTEVTT